MMAAATDESIPTSEKRALIPLERELEERLVWLIHLRWLAALGILFGGWFATSYVAVSLPAIPLYAIGCAVLIYNVFFRLTLHTFESRSPALKRSIYAQIGLDWIALVALVHYSGGIRSPVALAFIFHLIIGAILLSRTACFFQAAVAVLLSGALTATEQLGIWIPPTLDNESALSGPYKWVALSILFLVTAYLATSISGRLRQKEVALSNSELQMESLHYLAQVINATFDMKEVLGLIAEHGARLLGLKAGFIRLFDPNGKTLRIGGAYGLSKAYLDKGTIEIGKRSIDAEALDGNTVEVLDATSDPRFQYPEEARREGICSVLCLPVSSKNRALGVLRVYSAKPHHFSEDERKLLGNLANLGAVAIENAHAYADLRRLSEERVRFARITHHQLRAPLAAIQGMLDALPYAGELSEKQQDFINRSRRRVEDALELIEDLLDLAAAQRLTDERSPENVVLNTALDKAIETARERAAHKGVKLDVNLPEEKFIVRAQAEDIHRIFSNLLDNGVKYTPPEGRVSLGIFRDGNQVRAEVVDSGIGINETDQERIFEKFYRTPTAKATGETGTGLGLCIAKQLIERWGGELELQSAPGQGTKFIVRFPLNIESGQS